MEEKLNGLLADLVYFYHKLQSYHWYVGGYTFFQSHEKLEEYYDMINPQIDDVAEMMLQAEMKPVSTVAAFTANTKIKEAPGNYVTNVDALFSDVLADFRYLLKSVTTIKEEADEAGNYLISAKMDEYIASYSKAIWMLSQTLMK